MGDVTEFKPKKPKDGDNVMRILSCKCGQATWIFHTAGYIECPICGVTVTSAVLRDAGFFGPQH